MPIDIPQGLALSFRQEEDERRVDARGLWEFLEIETPFRDWVKRRIENYGFRENKDFRADLRESQGGRPSKEYLLTGSIFITILYICWRRSWSKIGLKEPVIKPLTGFVLVKQKVLRKKDINI